LTDLNYLADLLQYKPGWAKFKATELGLTEPKPNFQPFFDGVAKVHSFQVKETKTTYWGIGQAKSLAGVMFDFLVTNEKLAELATAIIPGCSVTFIGPWSDSGKLLVTFASPANNF
jgi:hypothetical protein